MNKLLLISLAFFLCAGCSIIGIKAPPSVCDNKTPGESVLCDIAGKYDLRLETVGDLFLVVNLRAIKEGAYTKEDAQRFFTKASVWIEAPVSVIDLRMLVLGYVADVPELLLISPYLAYMDVSDPISESDREMMRWWVDYNLRLLK